MDAWRAEGEVHGPNGRGSQAVHAAPLRGLLFQQVMSLQLDCKCFKAMEIRMCLEVTVRRGRIQVAQGEALAPELPAQTPSVPMLTFHPGPSLLGSVSGSKGPPG